MCDPRPHRFSLRRLHLMLVVGAATTVGSACAGSGRVGPAADVATDDEWRALRVARPTPLPDAARVTVLGMEFLGSFPWTAPSTVRADLGVAELAVAGLLRRRDVHFVERRRFSAAAEAARRGVRLAPGAPPPGVSQSAEFATTAVWIPLGTGQAAVEVRLVTMETGAIAGATRVLIADDADPVTLARAVVDGVLDVLGDLDRLPSWDDPLRLLDGASRQRVSAASLRSFLSGLASEEIWDWEGARRGYQAAAADPAFHEASTTLARTARLRLGGTLAES